ncbi:MAG: hypothetical protein BGO70_16460 [Bacteroidetes bacterium 43-93]|nr:hypothetical protein [Bacteroidota bacterium]OJX01355.1 MAG: hypothetical protein BGO70_16460 [Bacteroidetes bacterium 43-93]
MRRFSFIAICGLLFLTACKKEQLTKADSTPAPAKSKLYNAASISPDGLADEVSVSAYGFLVLPDTNVYAHYIDFLDSNSANNIAAFHSSIGFSSQAAVQGQAGNYIPPSVNNGEYVFNQSGIVQIGSIVYRGVNSEGYLLAMPVNYLNAGTYAALVNKQFLPSVMCKLKVGGSYGDNPEAFILGNIGYADVAPPPPAPVICGKKVTHTYTTGNVTVQDTSWYFLGIRYRHEVIIIIHD